MRGDCEEKHLGFNFNEHLNPLFESGSWFYDVLRRAGALERPAEPGGELCHLPRGPVFPFSDFQRLGL